MKAMTVYETTDGSVFNNENEAAAHQHQIDARQPVEAFVDEAGYARGQRTQAINAILNWEAFKATGTITPVVKIERKTKKTAEEMAEVEGEGSVLEVADEVKAKRGKKAA